MKVYAGSRRGTVETPMEGLVPVKLDVNDASRLEAVVDDIIAAEGRLDAVICNAGNGVYGPIEGTLEEEARSQFETTFFGSLKSVEACIPVFRRPREVSPFSAPVCRHQRHGLHWALPSSVSATR